MNFQQKYLKYKLKYTQLKDQLKGGACIPVPVPTDKEYISLDEYQNIPAARLETIGGHCYDIVELANWIHLSADPNYPATGLPMSLNDIWSVITAYNAYRIIDPASPIHFIFTPAQSAQIIVALSNPPVPLAIRNLIKKIRRDSLRFIIATPVQRLLFNGIIPVLPAALVPGTRYIQYILGNDTYSRTDPFIDIDPENGHVGFGDRFIFYSSPELYHFYNEADLVANGLPLPA